MMIQKQKGFTLPEILIAVAMFAMLGLFTASVMNDLNKMNQQAQKEVEGQTDISLATLYLTKILKSSKPSFNNLINQKDDNGKEFFDFYSDVPTSQWKDVKEETRTFTMSEKTGQLEFYAFTEDPKQKDAIAYDPRTAYDDVDPVIGMNTSAVLVYRGLDGANFMTKRYPDLWVTGQAFLLRVPIPLRFVPADGVISMEAGSVPRELSFIGLVSGKTLSTSSLDSKSLSHLWNHQPVDGSVVNNPDDFFRKIPSVGGSAPLVLIDAIRLMRISMEKNAAGRYDLFLSEFKDGNFDSKVFVGTNIKELVLSRESVSRSILRYKLTISGATK